MTTPPNPAPKRGASLPGGYIADGKGGKVTPAQYRQQERDEDARLAEWKRQQGVLPKEPKP